MAPDVSGLQQLDWKGPRGRFSRVKDQADQTDGLIDRADDRQPDIQIGRQTDRERQPGEIDRTSND